MDTVMDESQNHALVREIMQTFREATNRLLPEAWLRRWPEPDVDAEALLRSLAESVEDLWMYVDALVLRVQQLELMPEIAVAQARERLIETIHQLLPTVEVRQRFWHPRKYGTLVELATYQVTIERLLAELHGLSQRLSRPLVTGGMPATAGIGWEALLPMRNTSGLAVRGERRAGLSAQQIPSGDQPLRHIRVTRRLLVDGQVVREDVAEAEVPLSLDDEAAVAAVQAQLPPWQLEEMPAHAEQPIARPVDTAKRSTAA
jgi:hypothetical protein